jgi:shikimate dehydrogenase
VISGNTKVCAIIGDPVEHSLSPVIHNSAFNELGLNFVYVAFTVKAKELGTAISGARSMGFKGLNVTMPHKNAVMNYLDEVDATAKNIGAVNTILCNKEQLIGYNTDGKGAIFAMQNNSVFPENKKLVLLGAGGAGKAIAYQVAQDVGELVILNRTRQKAEKLAELIRKNFNKKVKGQSLTSSTLKEELEMADILINSTSVGMYPNVEYSPVPSDMLRSDLCVMDIIYNPFDTKLLKDANSVGAKIISGVEMLIHQGAIAFEIWTNCIAPLEVMRKAALNHLKKQGVHP